MSSLKINESQRIGSLFAKQQGQQQQQRRSVSFWLPEQQHRQPRQRHLNHHHQQLQQRQQQQRCESSALPLLHIETATGKMGLPARIPMPRIGCVPGGDYCGGTSTSVSSGWGSGSITRTNSCGVSRALHTPSSANSSFPLEIARAPVECGVVSPRRTVPAHIPKTPYYANGAVPPADNTVSGMIWLAITYR